MDIYYCRQERSPQLTHSLVKYLMYNGNVQNIPVFTSIKYKHMFAYKDDIWAVFLLF